MFADSALDAGAITQDIEEVEYCPARPREDRAGPAQDLR
jgi:hypothetical protein